MGFFDFVENTADQAQEPVTIPAETAAYSGLNNKKPVPMRKTSLRSGRIRPERLKFLKPCPICQGIEFTHQGTGGFYCNTCQPGIEGSPVVALGHRATQKTVDGFPCIGCGSTTYTKEKNGFIFDDGTLADGWHCGGKNCQVVLMIEGTTI